MPLTVDVAKLQHLTKARVRGHLRVLRDGRQMWVQPYDTSREVSDDHYGDVHPRGRRASMAPMEDYIGHMHGLHPERIGADWSSQAYGLGGNLYFADNEDGTWSIVHRDLEDEDGGQDITEVSTFDEDDFDGVRVALTRILRALEPFQGQPNGHEVAADYALQYLMKGWVREHTRRTRSGQTVTVPRHWRGPGTPDDPAPKAPKKKAPKKKAPKKKAPKKKRPTKAQRADAIKDGPTNTTALDRAIQQLKMPPRRDHDHEDAHVRVHTALDHARRGDTGSLVNWLHEAARHTKNAPVDVRGELQPIVDALTEHAKAQGLVPVDIGDVPHPSTIGSTSATLLTALKSAASEQEAAAAVRTATMSAQTVGELRHLAHSVGASPPAQDQSETTRHPTFQERLTYRGLILDAAQGQAKPAAAGVTIDEGKMRSLKGQERTTPAPSGDHPDRGFFEAAKGRTRHSTTRQFSDAIAEHLEAHHGLTLPKSQRTGPKTLAFLRDNLTGPQAKKVLADVSTAYSRNV